LLHEGPPLLAVAATTSRRQVLKKVLVGTLAVLAPVVATLAVPTPAQAQSTPPPPKGLTCFDHIHVSPVGRRSPGTPARLARGFRGRAGSKRDETLVTAQLLLDKLRRADNLVPALTAWHDD